MKIQKWFTTTRVVVVALSIAFCVSMLGLVSVNTTSASAQSPQLVYICQKVPCTNSQELEVFDNYGAPIFSVGEYGGAAVFGDNLRVYPPGSVFNPSVTESYKPPTGACVSPSIWLSPQGLWKCQGTAWHEVLNLGS